jgi:hypothetical protein
MVRSILLGGALLIAALSPASARESLQAQGEAKLAKDLAGRVAGAPVQCIPNDSTVGIQIYDGTAIVYRSLRGITYVNRPRGAELLRWDDIPVARVYGSQYCRLDQVRLLDRDTRTPRGVIALGDFVPYTKAPPAR